MDQCVSYTDTFFASRRTSSLIWAEERDGMGCFADEYEGTCKNGEPRPQHCLNATFLDLTLFPMIYPKGSFRKHFALHFINKCTQYTQIQMWKADQTAQHHDSRCGIGSLFDHYAGT